MICTYLFISAWSIYCAWNDRQQIQRGQRILHALQWVIRCLVAVGMVVVVAGFGLKATFLAIGSGALFSMVFRFSLNTMRGLDWRYIAPWSSLYDRTFVVLVAMPYGVGITDKFIDLVKADYFKDDLRAKLIIHRAGMVAYACELVVLVACSYLSSVL